MSHEHRDDDDGTNTSDNPTFDNIVRARLSRRRVLLGLGATAFFAGCSSNDDSPPPASPPAATPAPTTTGTSPTPTPTPAPTSKPPAGPPALGFDAVPKGLADAVVVPAGYTATVLYRLGDPIAAGVPAYKNDGSDTGDSHAQRAGDHHDGMYFFGLGANGKYAAAQADRALLVMNHEALTPAYLHVSGPTKTGTPGAADEVRTVADEVVKEMNAQGVSVIEIANAAGKWSYKQSSSFNRRITTSTPMDLSGPAAKTSWMITKYSTDGSKTRGTVNNCANGHTPWGTYLTCEENWAGYFRRIAATDDANRTAAELTALKRYAIAGNGRELWATVLPDTADELFGRWNAEKLGASADGSDDYRNGPNTFGWVVEIDPFATSSTPRKRTALGRFAHENCALGAVVAGKPLVFYMGCDSRNEYIYKFVSKRTWDPADAMGGLAAGDKYLDDGTLYVARFDSDGNGTWLELTFGVGKVTASNVAYAFADQADVLVHARLAADAQGATKMDRPEWGAVNPANGEIYFTLTNNAAAQRPIDKLDAANPRFYDDPKGAGATPQKGNPNGHIIRMLEGSQGPAGTAFKWDIYLFGARSGADTSINVSGLTPKNDFSSPDGCWFSQATPGLLWIETDDAAYTDVTNCMLLASMPGTMGDGPRKTITNVDGATTVKIESWVGKPASETTLRRFLVGPKECEITGVAEAPDGKTLFVNIQHPGEETVPDLANPTTFGSHWPDGGNARPRTSTLAITRNDGGKVGLS